jgi:hypothetical protein
MKLSDYISQQIIDILIMINSIHEKYNSNRFHYFYEENNYFH